MPEDLDVIARACGAYGPPAEANRLKAAIRVVLEDMAEWQRTEGEAFTVPKWTARDYARKRLGIDLEADKP